MVEALVILMVIGTQLAEANQYNREPVEYEYESFTPEFESDTKWVDAAAIATGNGNNEMSSCNVHACVQVTTEDSGTAFATAIAGHGADWVWDGPPGTGPGGTLSWEHDGWGSGFAVGYRGQVDPNDPNVVGSTYAYASIRTITAILDPDESIAESKITASVEDDNETEVEEYFFTRPPGEHVWWRYTKGGSAGKGSFGLSINWGVFDYGSTPIPAGTGVIYFLAGAYCITDVEASVVCTENTEGLVSLATTYGSAMIRTNDSFTLP